MNTKILAALVMMFSLIGVSGVGAQALSIVPACDGVCGNLNGVSAVAAPVFSQVAVTNVANTSATAKIGKGYDNGWAWTFTLQVPCAENALAMKFTNWMGASALTGSFAADGNTRFSADGGATWVDSGNAYGATANLSVPTGCDSEVGYAAIVYVQTKVPAGAHAGSYASNYGIKTTTSLAD
jgi:hypothetical protein